MPVRTLILNVFDNTDKNPITFSELIAYKNRVSELFCERTLEKLKKDFPNVPEDELPQQSIRFELSEAEIERFCEETHIPFVYFNNQLFLADRAELDKTSACLATNAYEPYVQQIFKNATKIFAEQE